MATCTAFTTIQPSTPFPAPLLGKPSCWSHTCQQGENFESRFVWTYIESDPVFSFQCEDAMWLQFQVLGWVLEVLFVRLIFQYLFGILAHKLKPQNQLLHCLLNEQIQMHQMEKRCLRGRHPRPPERAQRRQASLICLKDVTVSTQLSCCVCFFPSTRWTQL